MVRQSRMPGVGTIADGARMSAQCDLVFPTSYSLRSKWGGPPGPQPTPSSACLVWIELNLFATGGGRGGRPRNAVQLPVLGKLSGIAHSCYVRQPLAEQVNSRQIDNFVPASAKNGREHEKAKALGLL